MSETGQYIRIRGKVTGPFDVATLQKLVRRGALSRIHEVSPDRVNWAPAGEYEELFPAAPAPVAIQTEPVPEYESPPATPPAATAVSESYFYAQNGVTVGPVPLNVLVSLAQNGTLESNDLCWPDGAQLASAAGQLPALAPIFSGKQSTASGKLSTARPGGRLARTATSSAHWSRNVGIFVAGLLLVALNLPVGTYHDRTVWWWESISEPGSGTMTLVLFFVLFSALIIGPIASLTTGLLRAWFFVGTAIISLALFLALGLNTSADGSYFFGLFVPYSAAVLIGISAFRVEHPDSRAGAISQGIAGGALVFALIVLGILAMAANSPATAHSLNTAQMPGWLLAVATIGIIGGIAGLAGGILGLFGFRQTMSTGVNGAAIGCCVAAILLPILAILIGAGGSVDLIPTDQKDTVLFLFIRFCAAFAGYLALMGTGTAEMFNSYQAIAD
jgi:hypothetical protein